MVFTKHSLIKNQLILPFELDIYVKSYVNARMHLILYGNA